MKIIAAISLMLILSGFALACQESCREYEVGSRKGQLLDWNRGKRTPIAGAVLIVRDMNSGQHTVCGGRKGGIVAKIRTGQDSTFTLKGLPAGHYWITYEHPERGESFFVALKPKHGSKRFDLTIDDWIGSLCSVPDIERNATKPPGWTLPVEKD